jgi:hypothetical protein
MLPVGPRFDVAICDTLLPPGEPGSAEWRDLTHVSEGYTDKRGSTRGPRYKLDRTRLRAHQVQFFLSPTTSTAFGSSRFIPQPNDGARDWDRTSLTFYCACVHHCLHRLQCNFQRVLSSIGQFSRTAAGPRDNLLESICGMH